LKPPKVRSDYLSAKGFRVVERLELSLRGVTINNYPIEKILIGGIGATSKDPRIKT
jgi:hypothetical protein